MLNGSQANAPESDVVTVLNRDGGSHVVLVCEHASNHIPARYGDLGLTKELRSSHIAWDPGALGVAVHVGKVLSARVVAGNISRLVYDCNRPPDACDAIPARSEIFDIPGNVNLNPEERDARIRDVYRPFEERLHATMQAASGPARLVTLHSFTPVYCGKRRDVEIGVLHDADRRLADAMLHTAAAHTDHVVRRNEPYGPGDGVTHTLKLHGVAQGLPNVMIEIRNDLIATEAQQRGMGEMIGAWLTEALSMVDAGAKS